MGGLSGGGFVRWLAALVPLLLFVSALPLPGAQAQAGVVETSIQVTIEDPGRALMPGRNETVPMSVNYIWRQGAAPLPDPATVNGTKNTTIRLSIKQVPSWVTEAHIYPDVVEVNFPATVFIGGNRVVGGPDSPISVNLTLDPLAPALSREDIIVVAEAEENGNLKAARGENLGTKVRADIVPTLNVTAQPLTLVPGGRWAVVPFTVANEGNFDIVAELAVVSGLRNGQTRAPSEVEVKKGESVVVEVEVRLPWTEAEFGTLGLSVTPVLSDREARAVSAETEVRSTSAVPGPGIGALLVVFAVLALRRR